MRSEILSARATSLDTEEVPGSCTSDGWSTALRVLDSWCGNVETCVMVDKERRKELLAQHKQAPPEAGVYRIVNRHNGKALLGSTLNLGSMRGKLEFGRATNSPGVLDHRLVADARQVGLDAFELEILEVLEVRPEMTPAEIRADLATLEALWRERLDPAHLY